jgi:hypothetical protein
MSDRVIMLTPKQAASAVGCETRYLIDHEEDLGLNAMMTPGGHRRYALNDVQRLVDRYAVVRQADVALAKLLIVQNKKID